MHNIFIWFTFSLVSSELTDNIDFTALGPSPRRDLLFPELVKYDGYPCESHYVTTEDHYILGLFRINTAPHNDSCPCDYADREPIIYVHGLFLSGDDCIVPGRGRSHCYNFADACYDVWIANSRGNHYSRNHTTLNPDKDKAFWDFSFDEMARKDMPAIIDYVLEKTKKTQVVIVSHSQGATVTYLLCAAKPEYNDKIKYGFGFSPTGWLDHSKFFVIGVQALVAGALEGKNDINFEILRHIGPASALGKFLCGLSELQYPVCMALLFTALGYDRFQIKSDTINVLPGHFLAGTSMKDFVHWGQVRKNGFNHYDFGASKNLEIYGQKTAPPYNLSSVTTKWIFFAGLNDYVAPVADVQKLVSAMPNAELCVLKDKNWGHLDFIYADNLAVYLDPQILRTLDTCNFTCNLY
ncbi:gastric triacylglycerol lipase-like isoform X2 [Plodia interpunctella]|nr:gastric triacylglycerol lipase-like isoform X2 [Plodia interpunctella]